jgi:diguanylate cyclase (GGDEF)-like protein/PAS domain S-box-containing protein
MASASGCFNEHEFRIAALTRSFFGGTLTPPMPDAKPDRDKHDRRNVRSLDDPETLKLLIRSIGEGIYISDSQGRILDANVAFLEIFGMSSLEELQRYEVPQLLADPNRRKEELTILANEGSVREFELEIVRPDGARRTVLDTTYQVKDPETGEVAYHGVLFDITRRKELEDRLREQLTRDTLTGCYNRRFLLDLEETFRAGGETRWGCIFIDIDHFKSYNDRHGHASGDQVLQRMARFLMREVRSDEPVIRLGGDEFLIVLAGENSQRTPSIAERLRQAAARSAPVAFSLGWAMREEDESFEQTIERADHVLINVRVLSRSGDYATLPNSMERRRK